MLVAMCVASHNDEESQFLIAVRRHVRLERDLSAVALAKVETCRGLAKPNCALFLILFFNSAYQDQPKDNKNNVELTRAACPR